ncbi:MAG: hypothetical protein ABR527_01095 [Gemmatimonadota bacterium]
MAQLQCPNCGTTYDVSQYPPGHRFQCTCGRELTVGASSGSGAPTPGPAAATPGTDPGLQPVIKALVFLGNLCFSPLAALISTIIYFVIKDQKPRTAKDLCQMTWIPFVIACVLWILYFVFVFGIAILGSN